MANSNGRPASQFDVILDPDVSQEADPLVAYLKNMEKQTTGATGTVPIRTTTAENPDTSGNEEYEPREARLKGTPKYLLSNQSVAATSSKALDCRGYNAAVFIVIVTGSSPSATITIQGAIEEGFNPYLTLSDPGGIQTAVVASKIFSVSVGTPWVNVKLSSVTGGNYTVIGIPYVAGMDDAAIITLAAASAIIGKVGIDQTAGQNVTSEQPIVDASGDVNVPASNTAAVVTYAADATHKHVITGIAWSYAGGLPVGGNLKVEDVSGTVVFSMDITDQGAGIIVFPKPKKGAAINTAMIVTLAAGGAGVTGKISCLNHWVEV